MMKKLLFSIIAIAGIGSINAQETKFGAKAGLAMVTVDQTVTVGGITVTASGSETGFFAGGFVEIGVNDTFSIQPELLYVGIRDFNMINMPILGKFTFAEKFSAMAGPGITYMLDAEEDEFKVNVDIAAGYEITESLDVTARYSLGFGDVKVGGFYAGVGYKF